MAELDSRALRRNLERRLAAALTVKADPDLGAFDWNNLADGWESAVRLELERTYSSAYISQAAAADVPRAQGYAADYARERAGELLSGKDSIPDVSLRRLGELVSQAIDSGASIGQLRQNIEKDLVFSRERAQTIAVTETAFALGAGGKQAAQDQGQDEKMWETSDDEVTCEECTGNADDGWIGIDDLFSSGDDAMPAHPNCRCDVVYRTASEAGADAGDAGDTGGDVTAAARPPVVRQVVCPKDQGGCGRRLPVNNLEGAAEVYCRRCNKTFTIGAGLNGHTRRTPKARSTRQPAAAN